MLRPATPLAILLLIAFVLLLLSVISTPIVKGIPLASFQGVQFGVFGYCKGTQCTGVQVGYTTNSQTLFGNSKDDADFSLPPAARSSLSSILIVHPVAALLTLICFILAATAHLHSPSHSPRYLLALLILLLPTLLLSLLAFLVDILLFVPHLQWGGWIVLASTILIAASGVVTCAMRRTLVNRKARKKRIAENAEMSGANFYNREQDTGRAESPPPLGPQSNIPAMANGTPVSEEPTFATFEPKRAVDEERIPLNQRSLSNKTLPSTASATLTVSEGEYDRHGSPGRGGRGGMQGGRGGRYNVPRDEYGNPLQPSDAFGPLPPGSVRQNPSDRGLDRQYSNETNVQGFRARGRGGYPPRGYGRGGPYGPGRGGPGMNGNGRGVPRGAVAPGAGAGYMAGEMGGRGQRGPPPGYGNEGPTGTGRSPSAPGYGRRPSPGPPSAPGNYGRRPSPGPPSAPGVYGRQAYPGPPSAPGGYGRQSPPGPPVAASYGGRQASPSPHGQTMYRGESPPPPLPIQHPPPEEMIGQAVEMDAFSASPLQSPSHNRPMQLRDSDSDVGGLVALQQQRPEQQHDSITSVYSSQEQYVPPRTAWAGAPTRKGTPPNFSQPRSPLAAPPVELPTEATPRIAQEPQNRSHQHTRFNSGDNYYEDVDPRFAAPEEIVVPQHQPPQPASVPSSLIPGHAHNNIHNLSNTPNDSNYQSHLEPSSSFESIQEGARSPAVSGDSDYTSISQRGINPAWRPPPQQQLGPGPYRGPPPPQQQRDMLLGGNPDFELPGRGGRMGGGGGRGGRGGGPPPGPYPGGLI